MVTCRKCGRTLTNPDSVQRRLGPYCAREEGLHPRQSNKRMARLDPLDPLGERHLLELLRERKIRPIIVSAKNFVKTRKKLEKDSFVVTGTYVPTICGKLSSHLRMIIPTNELCILLVDRIKNNHIRQGTQVCVYVFERSVVMRSF